MGPTSPHLPGEFHRPPAPRAGAGAAWTGGGTHWPGGPVDANARPGTGWPPGSGPRSDRHAPPPPPGFDPWSNTPPPPSGFDPWSNTPPPPSGFDPHQDFGDHDPNHGGVSIVSRTWHAPTDGYGPQSSPSTVWAPGEFSPTDALVDQSYRPGPSEWGPDPSSAWVPQAREVPSPRRSITNPLLGGWGHEAPPMPEPVMRATPTLASLTESVRTTLSVVCAVVAIAASALAAQAVWDLWGSNVYTSQRQDALAGQLATVSISTVQVPVAVVPGDAVGRLQIPAIGVDQVIVAGTGRSELRSGPGWYPQTVFPGDVGNAAIAGHRTTYGAPFEELDKLGVGDRLSFSAPNRPDAWFEVRSVMVIEPGDTWVVAPTGGVRLTLTTCHPLGSNAQRLVVQAELVDGANAAYATPPARWYPSGPGVVPPLEP
jgi:LPXTG-site transpeptidase (sortase) family protein